MSQAPHNTSPSHFGTSTRNSKDISVHNTIESNAYQDKLILDDNSPGFKKVSPLENLRKSIADRNLRNHAESFDDQQTIQHRTTPGLSPRICNSKVNTRPVSRTVKFNIESVEVSIERERGSVSPVKKVPLNQFSDGSPVGRKKGRSMGVYVKPHTNASPRRTAFNQEKRVTLSNHMQLEN